MIYYKTDEEIELIRKSCLLVSKTLAMIAEILRPGVRGIDVDKLAEEFICDHGAVPGFKGLYGFPNTLTISRNHAVVHGVPSKEEFKDGEIASIDCGVYWDDFYGDSAYTFAIGDVNESVMRLLEVTNDSLYAGIEQVEVGKRLGDVGFAIQSYINNHNYSIVRDLVGHGVGRSLHEEPKVPNYGRRGQGLKLKEGLVIAIEPMINMGRKEVYLSEDGHTIVTRDGKPSAHFEHTVAVRKKGVDVLSDQSLIEIAMRKNVNLKNINRALATA